MVLILIIHLINHLLEDPKISLNLFKSKSIYITFNTIYALQDSDME